jgi:hypothetical protein
MKFGQAWWYMLVIPVTQEVEIRRMAFQGQQRQTVNETLTQPTN